VEVSQVEAGTLRGLATLLALLAFVGVVWWAWSGRQKQQFDRAAHMPLEEDLDKNEDN
jgi:cytochrome c oxidase cbb3-type subunit 4